MRQNKHFTVLVKMAKSLQWISTTLSNSDDFHQILFPLLQSINVVSLIFNELVSQQRKSPATYLPVIWLSCELATKCRQDQLIQRSNLIAQLVYIQSIIFHTATRMNLQQNQPQYKPVYYLQRPNSPKNMLNHANSAKNISLTMSIGPNQNPTTFLPQYKTKQELQQTISSQTSLPMSTQKSERQIENELRLVFKQNASLREENQNLKRQLQRFRKQVAHDSVRSSQKHSSPSPQPYNDLRGTIKKEMGEMKQMRIKLDMLSKQVKMYEEMIDKMDERIKKLSHDNSKKNATIDDLQNELSKLDHLKDKTNSIMRMYSDLQSKFNDHQLQWMKWKQNWLNQKEIYLERIRELERRCN